MFELFDYSFMIRALLGGLLIAVTLPVLGNFLVARRYSLIADSLAHVSLAGIGAGLLFGSSPIFIAVPAAIAGALMLEWLRQKRRLSGEISLAIVMSTGLALAVVLANLAQQSNVDFASYLFGSITTTTSADLIVLGTAAIIALGTISIGYRAFLHIAFDEDAARISGHRVTALNYLLVAVTALIVVLSLRIVGGLLISALLVIPVVTASQFTKSFAQNIFVSIICAVVAVTAGLVFAFYAGVAAGGAIVLAAVTLLITAMIFRKA